MALTPHPDFPATLFCLPDDEGQGILDAYSPEIDPSLFSLPVGQRVGIYELKEIRTLGELKDATDATS